MISNDYNDAIAESEKYIKDETETDEASDEELVSESDSNRKDYDIRDHLYTRLLEQYIANNAEKAALNTIYKLMFFIIVVFAFGALTIAPAIVFCEIARKDSIDLEDAVLVLGGCVSVVSAIVVLPKIIAEHLFPTKEDENMIELVKQMQANDSNIRSSEGGNKD